MSECDQYLRLLLCDQDETVVVDQVAVDILPRGGVHRGHRGHRGQMSMTLDRNVWRKVWDFPHLVVAADAALAVQSGALHTQRDW